MLVFSSTRRCTSIDSRRGTLADGMALPVVVVDRPRGSSLGVLSWFNKVPGIFIKLKNNGSEIEDFVETHLCKL